MVLPCFSRSVVCFVLTQSYCLINSLYHLEVSGDRMVAFLSVAILPIGLPDI